MYQLRNDALVESGPTLKRFWAYKPNFTKGLEVTSISVHPTNGVSRISSLPFPKFSPKGNPLFELEHRGYCVWKQLLPYRESSGRARLPLEPQEHHVPGADVPFRVLSDRDHVLQPHALPFGHWTLGWEYLCL